MGNAELRTSAARSVIGRSENSSGQVADIVATSDGQILRRAGNALGFGNITGASIDNGTIPLNKVNTTGTASSATFLRGDGQWENIRSAPQNCTALDHISYTGLTPTFAGSSCKITRQGSILSFSLYIAGSNGNGAVLDGITLPGDWSGGFQAPICSSNNQRNLFLGRVRLNNAAVSIPIEVEQVFSSAGSPIPTSCSVSYTFRAQNNPANYNLSSTLNLPAGQTFEIYISGTIGVRHPIP